ncbi:PorT family protein [Pontibacter sp. JH31]|uniref:PorT family protein n=1 Tax=Pontibacter aquaedesilientis TaxID=2766980 RepID=A0ABR7XGJ5_9BACT|nr:porin family protein [Pontibacter aquaedesilientis]MBD1397407.1 PorT family protein [Pontibacter aquaedesilientis]
MKLTLYIILGLLLTLVSLTTVKAQKLQPAYLVTGSSDTLRGEVLLNSAAKMLYEIQFKQQGNTAKTYNAADIKGYGLDDSLRFESREVMVDEKTRTIFLKVVVDGPAKLYYAQNFHPSYEYFLQKQQQAVVPLHKNYYAGTLAAMLQECDALKNHRYRYSLTGLAKLVHTYNQCSHAEQKSIILHKQSRLETRWGLRVGASAFKPNYHFETGIHSNHDFDWATGITGGIFFNFGFQGKKFSLQPELLYTSRRAKSFYEHNQPHDWYYKSTMELDAHYLQLPVLLKYRFRTEGWQPYLNAGLSYGLALSKNFRNTVTYETGYTHITEITLEKYAIGYLAGAGVQRNALSADIRFNREISVSDYGYGNKDLQFNTWSLALGYTF